jgi:hypothetical protein
LKKEFETSVDKITDELIEKWNEVKENEDINVSKYMVFLNLKK